MIREIEREAIAVSYIHASYEGREEIRRQLSIGDLRLLSRREARDATERDAHCGKEVHA